jgi:hydrogenase maturation protein HypF
MPLRRVAVTVRGVVQGVGFRPFVYRIAQARGIAGWVQNEADMVRIEARGEPSAVAAFLDALRSDAPPQARIDRIDVIDLAAQHDGEATFQIRSSEAGSSPQPTLPADLATCEACLAEIRNPAERRYRYPFTNCTNCGPRWSIVRQLPYDRPRTSMAAFAMCGPCQAEYDNPADRRFHAQPIACPACGPQLKLLDPAGQTLASGPAALDAAVESLRAGRIVGLKGLGGFQLLVDATDAAAVVRLRERKHRPHRPLAAMFPSLDAARRHCEISDEAARVLLSPAAPIVLLRRKGSGFRVQGSGSGCPLPAAGCWLPAVLAPGNPYLGVMLPYTPLHHLLLADVARPLVCTSGNLSEEPMAIRTADALERLGPIADCLLTHDRPIVRPVDDSVVRLGPDGVQVLRRARGYAPLPVLLKQAAPTILAVGGHLKNTVALAIGGRGDPTPVVLSQHVGDLDNVASVDVFRRAIDDLLGFFHASPQRVACDLHPDYASTRHAEQLAERWGVPLVRVQHHHAHVAACMAEHGLEGPVLGFSWDGTGYGSDGTIWGGEALVCDGGTFRRVAHLRTFPLPGGDRAMREPRRSALGLLFELLGDEAMDRAKSWFAPAEEKPLLAMLRRGVNSPRTSSMGRLFDAVAMLCGLSSVVSFEGQAAMALEFAADTGIDEAYVLKPLALPDTARGLYNVVNGVPVTTAARPHPNPLPEGEGIGLVADWEPLIRSILADRAAGEPIGRISARFHGALARWAVAVARSAGCQRVVLSGGCFQNALLTDLVCRRLRDAGFSVFLHRQIPPGDGGIALGQVFVAARF